MLSLKRRKSRLLLTEKAVIWPEIFAIIITLAASLIGFSHYFFGYLLTCSKVGGTLCVFTEYPELFKSPIVTAIQGATVVGSSPTKSGAPKLIISSPTSSVTIGHSVIFSPAKATEISGYLNQFFTDSSSTQVEIRQYGHWCLALAVFFTLLGLSFVRALWRKLRYPVSVQIDPQSNTISLRAFSGKRKYLDLRPLSELTAVTLISKRSAFDQAHTYRAKFPHFQQLKGSCEEVFKHGQEVLIDRYKHDKSSLQSSVSFPDLDRLGQGNEQAEHHDGPSFLQFEFNAGEPVVLCTLKEIPRPEMISHILHLKEFLSHN